MDNPETLATLDTQDTGRRQTKHKDTTQKTKKMSNKNSTKNWGEPRCSKRVWHASYKTPAVLLI